MKALTLWPEWAWAVCCLFKRVENRGYKPPASDIGAPLMIHAGKYIGGRPTSLKEIDRAMEIVCLTAKENGWHYSKRDRGDYVLESTLPVWVDVISEYRSPVVEFVHDRIPVSCFVAQATLDRCVSPVDPAVAEEFVVQQGVPKWGTPGAHHWHLSGVELVTNDIPVAGKQRLWPVCSKMAGHLEFARTPSEWIEHYNALTNGEL